MISCGNSTLQDGASFGEKKIISILIGWRKNLRLRDGVLSSYSKTATHTHTTPHFTSPWFTRFRH